MEQLKEICDSLSRVLSYPGEDYQERVVFCKDILAAAKYENEELRPIILAEFEKFASAIRVLPLGDIEELYTRTFDINPVSSLEVGWHLHGEAYQRGVFLVKMRDVLRKCGIEESAELPDHLTHVLFAVGRMEESDARVMVSTRLFIAMDKMLEGFAGKENPYEHLLNVTKKVLSEFCAQKSEKTI